MKLYKHVNNTDIAFELVKKYYIPEKDAYSIKVRWYRVRGIRVLWYFGIEERICIPRNIFRKNWEEVDYEETIGKR
jgi:hypothetical protein